eukprot:gene4105-5855_t
MDSESDNESLFNDQKQSRKRKAEPTSPSSEVDKPPKSGRVFGIDEEAVESDDEENNSQEDEDEDDENYKFDDFVVDENVEKVEEDDDEDLLNTRFENMKKSKSKQHKRLKKLTKTGTIKLDQDDIDLIRHNYQDLNAEEMDEDDGEDEGEIAPTLMDDREPNPVKRASKYGNNNDDDGSDMSDFIVQDVGEELSDDENDRGMTQRSRSIREVANTHKKGPREGPTDDQIQDAIAIFGVDYDDFDDESVDEDDDEHDHITNRRYDEDGYEIVDDSEQQVKLSAKERKNINKIRSRFDRSQLVSGFCTEKDDEIRNIDRPERFQSYLVGRQALSSDERADESKWMANKVAEKYIFIYEPSEYTLETLAAEFVEPIENILRFIQVDKFEVPFIWTYRKDYLHPLMKRAHLWLIYDLEEEWENMVDIKNRLNIEIEALGDAAEDVKQDEELELIASRNRIKELLNVVDSLMIDVQDAEEYEKRAKDVIDLKEEEGNEITEEDREEVNQATSALKNLRVQYIEKEDELQREKLEQDYRTKRLLRMALYDADKAKEVMRLFPKDRYLPLIEASHDKQELMDIAQFLALLIKGAEVSNPSTSNKNDTQDTDDIGDGQEHPEENYTVSRLKRRDEYSKYRKITNLRNFIEMIAVPVCDFADGLRHGFKVEPSSTPESTCEEVANGFLDDRILLSEQHVIKAASYVVATELSHEPTIKSAAREIYKSYATISTRPTAKGVTTLNPFHPSFGIHFLDRKPVKDFFNKSDRTLFIKLVDAEKAGLITVTINPPQTATEDGYFVTDVGPFLQSVNLPLVSYFMPTVPMQDDPFPHSRQTWDHVRLNILKLCIEKFFLPNFEQEIRRELLRVGRDAIIEESSVNFEKMLSYGGFCPWLADARENVRTLLLSCPNKSFNPSVACIFLSPNTTEPTFFAFVDKDGALKAHDLLPSRAISSRKDKIKKFIFDHRPDLIVVNSGGGYNCRSLLMTIRKEIIPSVTEAIQHERENIRFERENRGFGYNNEDDDEEQLYAPQSIILKDDVANIFKGSIRAKTLFPDLQPGAAAAICLARFAQEPLAEFCNIWTCANATELFGFEALFLDLHPLKGFLKGVKVPYLRALEHKLIDAVCEVGVDINKAVAHDHFSSMLAFVSGLGLRKADALRQNIRRSIGIVEKRKHLLEKKLLGKVVYNNAAGFLRVTDVGRNKILDPLENTRIHPECYVTNDFAQKICADALDVQHNPMDYIDTVEDLMKSVHKVLTQTMRQCPEWIDLWENYVRPVPGLVPFEQTIAKSDGSEVTLGVELVDKLFLLDLDAYAEGLERNPLIGKKRMQLEQIKDELRFPWLDLRWPLEDMKTEDMFTILTGESDESLYVGLKVGCTVLEVNDSSFYFEETDQYRRKQKVKVKTDGGLTGFISMYDVVDERVDADSFDMTQHLREGMRVQAVVISIKKDKLQVDLSVRPSYLSKDECWWVEQRDSEKYAKVYWETVRNKVPSALFDSYFLEKEALALYAESDPNRIKTVANAAQSTSISKSTATAGNSKLRHRTINHVLFANLDFAGAEDVLSSRSVGDIIIRPSSKGVDYLTITWAFQKGWFKHISVLERGNKSANGMGLGEELYVAEEDMKDTVFYDLDDIYSNYILPLNDHVAAMVKSQFFNGGSPEEVEQIMRNQLQERPERIPYFIRFDYKNPGVFVLTWMSTNLYSKAPIKKEQILVRPQGFKMCGQVFEKPSGLISWFKTSQSNVNAAAASKAKAQPTQEPKRPSRFNPVNNQRGFVPPPQPPVHVFNRK